jgi:hypothetical protein
MRGLIRHLYGSCRIALRPLNEVKRARMRFPLSWARFAPQNMLHKTARDGWGETNLTGAYHGTMA